MSDTGTDTDLAVDAPPEPERLYGELVTYSAGQAVLHVDVADLATVVKRLRDDEGFNMCLDVTAVDYLTFAGRRALPAGLTAERFEVVVSLISHTNRNRVRIRTQVSGDNPVAPSLFDIHPGTEAMEREVYDLFGIAFTDHPDLTRILMPEDWDGHPLRKDYAMGRIPVAFKHPVSER